jgi:hypothetical protein
MLETDELEDVQEGLAKLSLLLYSHEGLGDTTTNICHYGDHSQH